jgi:hypothetical protein
MPTLSSSFLCWFSGKALQRATEAFALLERSVAMGEWLPKASQHCRAAFRQANEPRKILNRNRWIEQLRNPGDTDYRNAGRSIQRAIAYGQWQWLSDVDFRRLVLDPGDATLSADEQRVVAEIARLWGDFRPILAAMSVLDRTRPRPVFTALGVSRRISGTLRDLGAVKVEVCQIEYQRIATTDAKGAKSWRWVARLLWPEGTVHGSSRYGVSQAGNRQCEACGHAIQNPGNWVPLVVWRKAALPQSLWVGRECAKSLFGIKMVGDFGLAQEQGDAAV